ncbi:MAG: ACT domain-containing protein [Chloroflexota bacterium]
MARQFVVQLKNRPGELAHLARALATRGINIRHIGGVGAGDVGCAFITTSDERATREVLHGLGHRYIEGAPILVEVLDQPGGIADAAERLAAAGVNICGTLIVGRRPGRVEMIFCVDDEAKARAALHQTEADEVGVPD